MSTPNAEHYYARSLVYHALADALYEPEAELPQSLLAATTLAAQTFDSRACQKAALSLASLPRSATADLHQRYLRITRNSAGRPLALYESLFREGRLMGQATIAAEEYYCKAGIGTGEGELPDHASVELAFLGHLAESVAEAYTAINPLLVNRLRLAERSFLRMHPGGWLPDVGWELAATQDPFYRTVGSLLAEFLTEELNNAWYRHSKRSTIPALTDAGACNLCGLCVGTCPLKALGVVENENETALALDVSRCVGCLRCLRGCPLEVLCESPAGASPSNGSGSLQILRRSARARCPVCGASTVSQAELDAVFAALQPDSVLERQMSLCVECKSSWNSW